MGADRLEELLAQTDAALPPPRGGAPLAERIRARTARRAKIQVGLTAAATMVVAMAAAYSLRARPPVAIKTHPTEPAFNVAAFRHELAALDAEATLHQRIADKLAASQREADALRQARFRAVLSESLPSPFQEARDRAARILLMDADRLVATGTARAHALDGYRRAIELFPDTPAAQEAQRRLKAGA